MGLAYANGALYIADAGNFRVRRVDLTTNIITTVAGDGSFSSVPDGMPATSGGISTWWITLDSSGNLFLGRLRMVDTSGVITTIAGQPGVSGWGADDIPALQTVFDGINGLGWDPVAQRLLISDGGTRIRQIFYTPATSTTVTSSKNPALSTETVTFQATVSPAEATGSVRFYTGYGSGTLLGSSPLVNGVATIQWTAPLGNSTTLVRAVYGGDPAHNLSQSDTLTETSQWGATTTTLVSSVNPSAQGQSVTFTASVTPAEATGLVNFLNGSTPFGSATIQNGIATFTTSTLAAGSNSIRALYAGDSRYFGGYSPVLTQVVKNSTTTSLTSSPNPSTFGSPVVLAAAVTPGTATGAVQFFNGATLLGSANLSGGQAQLSVTTLPAGADSLTAVYGGDSSDASSTSAARLQTVNKANSTTTLSVNPPSPANSGQLVTFTAKVTPASATGVVQFLDGSAVIGTATLNNGTAVFSISSLANGNHTIKASYGGDGNVNASQSATLNYKVKH